MISADDVAARLTVELSTPRRIRLLTLVMLSLAVSCAVLSLLLTEPSLPLRTQAAFGAVVVIGLTWVGFGLWALSSRRALFCTSTGRSGAAGSRVWPGLHDWLHRPVQRYSRAGRRSRRGVRRRADARIALAAASACERQTCRPARSASGARGPAWALNRSRFAVGSRHVWIASGLLLTAWLAWNFQAHGVSSSVYTADEVVDVVHADGYVVFTPRRAVRELRNRDASLSRVACVGTGRLCPGCSCARGPRHSRQPGAAAFSQRRHRRDAGTTVDAHSGGPRTDGAGSASRARRALARCGTRPSRLPRSKTGSMGLR